MPLVGDPIPLSVQLHDGATGKFVRARVYDPAGAEITGSPISVPHVAGGLYKVNTLVMPDETHVVAQYKVYDDAPFTTPSSVHGDASDIFERTELGGGGAGTAVTSDFITAVISDSDAITVTVGC